MDQRKGNSPHFFRGRRYSCGKMFPSSSRYSKTIWWGLVFQNEHSGTCTERGPDHQTDSHKHENKKKNTAVVISLYVAHPVKILTQIERRPGGGGLSFFKSPFPPTPLFSSETRYPVVWHATPVWAPPQRTLGKILRPPTKKKHHLRSSFLADSRRTAFSCSKNYSGLEVLWLLRAFSHLSSTLAS
ncbi:unnamed protein product [Ectocarpus sp. 8 AP-2014]